MMTSNAKINNFRQHNEEVNKGIVKPVFKDDPLQGNLEKWSLNTGGLVTQV